MAQCGRDRMLAAVVPDTRCLRKPPRGVVPIDCSTDHVSPCLPVIMSTCLTCAWQELRGKHGHWSAPGDICPAEAPFPVRLCTISATATCSLQACSLCCSRLCRHCSACISPLHACFNTACVFPLHTFSHCMHVDDPKALPEAFWAE